MIVNKWMYELYRSQDDLNVKHRILHAALLFLNQEHYKERSDFHKNLHSDKRFVSLALADDTNELK